MLENESNRSCCNWVMRRGVDAQVRRPGADQPRRGTLRRRRTAASCVLARRAEGALSHMAEGSAPASTSAFGLHLRPCRHRQITTARRPNRFSSRLLGCQYPRARSGGGVGRLLSRLFCIAAPVGCGRPTAGNPPRSLCIPEGLPADVRAATGPAH